MAITGWLVGVQKPAAPPQEFATLVRFAPLLDSSMATSLRAPKVDVHLHTATTPNLETVLGTLPQVPIHPNATVK